MFSRILVPLDGHMVETLDALASHPPRRGMAATHCSSVSRRTTAPAPRTASTAHRASDAATAVPM